MDQHRDTIDFLLAQADQFPEGLWCRWWDGGESGWKGGILDLSIGPGRRAGTTGGPGEREDEGADWIHAWVGDPPPRPGSGRHTLSVSHPHVRLQDGVLLPPEETGLPAPPREPLTPVSRPTPPSAPSTARRRRTPAPQVPRLSDV